MYGVFSSPNLEIVKTPSFQFQLYKHASGFGTQLFYENTAFAICFHDSSTKQTQFAYRDHGSGTDGSDEETIKLLRSGLTPAAIPSWLELIDQIDLAPVNTNLPLMDGSNLKDCLLSWRKAGNMQIFPHMFFFTLVTNRIEYVCQLSQPQDNVYCGASVNIVRDKGMLGGSQYFRIRHQGDDSAPYCQFFCNFPARSFDYDFDDRLFEPDRCNTVSGVNYWSLKEFTPTSIVLNGCSGDEYPYSRDTSATERYK